MKGLTSQTDVVFRDISNLSFIKEFTLVGGSALALQIHHRLSEDLDFCIWTKNLKKHKPTIDWPYIEKELETVGKISSRDLLGFDQVNFIMNGVKLTFMAKQKNLSPVEHPVLLLNNISAAEIIAVGAMKIELILRRSEFRDYYDIYSILKEGCSLKKMVNLASKYSNHLLKTRDALSYISNGVNFKKDKSFSLLNPVYPVDHQNIEKYIISNIQKEYSDT